MRCFAICFRKTCILHIDLFDATIDINLFLSETSTDAPPHKSVPYQTPPAGINSALDNLSKSSGEYVKTLTKLSFR